ncbi:hypothetical protein [Pantoea rodasii]|uniref:hypothetical protein n=1 Tax=Pantoea rodasii TaxID=1076549 RepID=UPI000FFCB371|nr:hypothetical protein [Pantoea rodasii]
MRNIYERNKSCRLIRLFGEFTAITTSYISGIESSVSNGGLNQVTELSVNKKIAIIWLKYRVLL